LTIRESRESDRAELVRMRLALWPDSLEEEVEGVVNRSRSEGVIIVAEREGGGLAGFAELGLRNFADGCRTSPVPYLEGIWTDPDAQRAGTATALFRKAESWARSYGYLEIASDCELHNEASRAFHEAAGFEEVQRSICFRREIAREST
jgi:aminoglycoside 6'-N-acetyltransferase I